MLESFFKKVSHDVKTDIQYPNEYRPKNNPSYQSGYNLDQKVEDTEETKNI